ncbi:MAG: hypothetical protein U5L45_16640 [Saprospiraceae bacterium]|nr:hypothetical protein [Saprospiraceae bacterium]
MSYALFLATLENRLRENLLGRACFDRKIEDFSVKTRSPQKNALRAIFERSEKEPVLYLKN